MLGLTMKKNLYIFLAVLAVLAAFHPVIASAGSLDQIDAAYSKLQKPWFAVVSVFARTLFWKLALVDFTWTTIVWVKDRKEFGEILAGFVGKIFTLGIFWMFLNLADTWIPMIISSFMEIGKAAAGVQTLSPDDVVGAGIDTAMGIYLVVKKMNLFSAIAMTIPLLFVAIFIVLGFAIIAGQLLVTQIESYIAIGGGVIMLGFGGSRWTSDMSTSYLKYAVGTGVKLMVIYLFIGAGMLILKNFEIDSTSTVTLVQSSFGILCAVAIFIYFSISISAISQAILSGSPSSSIGGLAGTAATAAGAATAAPAVAKAVTSGAAGAGAQMMGAGKAVGAGFDAARSAGSGVISSAAQAPFKAGASLAQTAGSKMASSAKGAMDSFKGAVNNSVGGKAAENIKSSGQASMSPLGGSAPSGNSGGVASPAPSGSAPSSAPSGSANSAPQPTAAVENATGSTAPSTNPTGDAANASMGKEVTNQDLMDQMQQMNSGNQKNSLSETLSKMRDFVVPPAEGAINVSGINIGHTKD